MTISDDEKDFSDDIGVGANDMQHADTSEIVHTLMRSEATPEAELVKYRAYNSGGMGSIDADAVSVEDDDMYMPPKESRAEPDDGRQLHVSVIPECNPGSAYGNYVSNLAQRRIFK